MGGFSLFPFLSCRFFPTVILLLLQQQRRVYTFAYIQKHSYYYNNICKDISEKKSMCSNSQQECILYNVCCCWCYFSLYNPTELLSSQISLVYRTRKRKIFPYTSHVYLVQPKNKSVRKTCFFLYIHSISLPKCAFCTTVTATRHKKKLKKRMMLW